MLGLYTAASAAQKKAARWRVCSVVPLARGPGRSRGDGRRRGPVGPRPRAEFAVILSVFSGSKALGCVGLTADAG